MGCAPSKGKLFSKPGPPGSQAAQLPKAPEEETGCRPSDEKSVSDETEEKENKPPPTSCEDTIEESANPLLLSSTTTTQNENEDPDETQAIVITQEIEGETDQRPKSQKTERRKKNKSKKRSSGRRRNSVYRAKLDFPPQMVRAHQAAYAFLNPNISKYETLLMLLDQAAQTQLSLQPMMSALALRFEEINQALEEMAEEGELMLKEHGDYMALPSGMMGPAVVLSKFNTATAGPPEPPPDLLQQLLKHSTEKMRLVSSSVQALGDTTLEEAVEYYSSLSKVLVGKLAAKQAAEQRVAQVLAQVEGAAMGKSNPEDSALHSEDSGIGGENESLTGSEKHRHRGSAGSGSCGSVINIRGTVDGLPNNSPNLVGHHEHDEEDEEEDDEDEDDEYNGGEEDTPGRKRSNSSPPDPSRSLLYMYSSYLKEQQRGLKRPMTAATAAQTGYPLSTSSAKIKVELQNSQRYLDQQMKKNCTRNVAGLNGNLNQTGLRRHSLSDSAGNHQGSFREKRPTCTLPYLAPQPSKRQSVRRLINTFSQGVDGRPGQCLANVPPQIRRPRKSGVLLLSDACEGTSVNNGNNNNNSWPDSKDDLDVDSLPPPPPEVLMDDSFETTEGTHDHERRLQEGSLPIIIQNTGVSQRLKASLQNVEALPNRTVFKPRSVTILPSRPAGQGSATVAQEATKKKPDKDQDVEYFESEMSDSLPVTVPPVSRVRLPPSCPSVCHRFPNPPVCRPQTGSRPASRPGSPRAVARASDDNTEVIVPSVSFSDARSVFSSKQAQNPSGCSVPPRPWGEAARGRLLVRRTDDSSRRTQSEQRQCTTFMPGFSKENRSASGSAKRRDSENREYRPASPLLTGDDAQLDSRS